MLHAVELPASITHLDASLRYENRVINSTNGHGINLANMDRDAFPHLGVRIRVEIV